jgi:hypothetical protein
MEKNKVDLRLLISDFENVSHNDITRLLGIDPIYIRIKGEKRNPKNPSSPTWTHNLWSMGSGLDEYASFEEQMNKILDIIEERMDAFKLLSSEYYMEFACAIFTYKDNGESTPSVHLEKRYNKIVGLLDIEFDIDLYVW